MPAPLGPIRFFQCLVLTAVFGLSPIVAPAQDASSPTATTLLADHPWLGDLDLSTPEAEMFLAVRIRGLEHYAPALQQLAALPANEQAAIREQVSTATPSDGDALVEDLRVPTTLVTAVIEEATANGADPEWDIPAFDEALTEIKVKGDTGAGTFADLVAIAPQSSAEIYMAVNSEELERARQASQLRLEDAQGRLVDAQERLEALNAVLESSEELLRYLK